MRNPIGTPTTTILSTSGRVFSTILTAGSCLFFPLTVQAEEAQKITPNIIIFYVDDLGWQDVQLNELDNACPYETPNIKRLAEKGMNFTEGYSPAPSCAPSRAGIITGQHPAKIKLTHVNLGSMKKAKSSEKMIDPYLAGPMDRNLLTIADAMKANGYKTGHSGKWHVGLNAASYGFDTVNQERGPHRRMEDRTKGFSTSKDPKYPLSKEKYAPFSNKNPKGISYPLDEVTESAIDFMTKSGDKPFFLNLCHWMVHWPVMTRNGALLEHYCDKLGQPFPPKPGDMSLPGQQNPYFAAMVTTVDWSLGRIVTYLENTDDLRNPGKKLSETTYLFFTSDNGGAERKGKEVISDNAPLKYGKTNSEEGGIRVPLIVSGPSIAAGTTFEGLVNQLDFFPTILSVTDSKIEADDFSKLSGLDISPVLHGKSEKITDASGSERDHLFWHFPHGGADKMKSAIRSGDYKLYKRFATDDYELYRLYEDGKRKDIEEANDLARNEAFAPVVKRLAALLEADLVANDAELPYLNPAFKDKTAPVATLGKSSFKADSRLAKLRVKASDATVKKAFVIYQELGEKKKHSKVYKDVPVSVALPQMSAPAEISEDGLSITATLPKGIAAFCFGVVDSNNYLQYTQVTPAQ
ncbi:sulfatase [Akkermansiaceae bacterium]|nr:sulfatase [Akkermansiaceae bacterium]